MNWKFWKRRQTNPQDWKPHWTIGILYGIWRIAFAAFKIALGAAATVVLIGLICCFVFVNMVGDYLESDILPNATMDLEGGELDLTSRVWCVDKNGQIQLLQKVFTSDDREWATYDQIPEALIHATVAIEDQRFYEHQGVDWFTTIKACARMFFGDSSVGGSSITQQLVKNSLLLEGDESANDITVQRKVIEIFRALSVERAYDKEHILEEYLNTIYLGQGCSGVRSAAAAYFGKELEMLTVAECASLISITNNPSLFDPYGKEFEYQGELMTGKERNRVRQELVLMEMLDQGWITQQEFDEAWNQEIVLKNGISFEDSLATCSNKDCGYQNIVSTLVQDGENFFCPNCGTQVEVTRDASQSVYSWYVDTVLEDVAKDLAEKNGVPWNYETQKLYMKQISRAGYNIYACIDLEVQEYVDAVYKDLSQIPDTRSGQQLLSGIVIVDNNTGNIVALAGGVGPNKGFDDWNLAVDADLQTGSSIKPLSVYAPAFESGAISPATVIKDLPLNYDNDDAWPRNDSKTYNYSYTIYNAVIRSINAVAANTLDLIGTGYSYDFAKNYFGLHNLIDEYIGPDGVVHSDEDFAPLAMGAQTFGLSIREMATAYATFANKGVYREGRTYTKVYDSNGNLVLDNTQDSEKILSDKTVTYMNYCLQNATRSGTGYEADLYYSYGITTAGKTGTTADNKDKWYCGFTGYYTAAVWCGYETPEPIRLTGGGSNPSAQLFKKVMGPLHQGKSNIALYSTSGMMYTSVCLDSGKKATDACAHDVRLNEDNTKYNRVVTVLVYPEDVPKETCDKHVEVEYCLEGGGVATDYCRHFAEVDEEIVLEKRALVKMTRDELEEIAKCKDYKLEDFYESDNYIYFIKDNGADGIFEGIYGKLKQDVEAPYVVCPVHTQEAWEKYQEEHPEDPEEPTKPDVPTFPGVDGLH